MRLVGYNILDGGEGREDALAEVIQGQRPDLVALVEADDEAVVDRLAARLGFDFVHARGNRHGSALLSRWPILESINHAPLHPAGLEKSLMEATVVEPSGREWILGVAHLHAHATEAAEERREREREAVLGAFARHRASGRPHLLGGDFNSNAPYQRIDPARCKPRTRREWEENGGGLPRRVVQRLLDAGYLDTLRTVEPGLSETRGTFSTEIPGQRVDYVFAFGIEPARLNAAWVMDDRPARDASDHFPVGVEIN